MKIDLASFAFGCTLVEGTGTPPWGTSLGQKKPQYKFNHEDYQNVVAGMVYNAVPLRDVWLPIGKGGVVVTGIENYGIQLAAVFSDVYVNGRKINHPFSMVLYKENSISHCGRRHLKYTPKISFRDKSGFVHSNEDFIKEVHSEFGLADDACWFVYEIDMSTQTELHMKAVFVRSDGPMVYENSKERKDEWMKLVDGK